MLSWVEGGCVIKKKEIKKRRSSTCDFLVWHQISERRQMRGSQNLWRQDRVFRASSSDIVFCHVGVLQALWHWQDCGYINKKTFDYDLLVLMQRTWNTNNVCAGTNINLASFPLQRSAQTLIARGEGMLQEWLMFRWPRGSRTWDVLFGKV